MEKITFAYAVSKNKSFESKHFGASDKFLFFRYADEKFSFITEKENIHKDMDKEKGHGLKEKGEAIINLLKERKVQVLVAKQFGENIKIINKHFVPVIVQITSLEDVNEILKKHIFWIEDEIRSKKKGHNLFTIRNSIMKTAIEE